MLSQLKSQQNLAGRIFLTLVLAAICGGLVNADSIVLKSGQRIDGEVLKVQKDTLFVDIGVDVIRVPVDQIAERIESKPESTTPKSNTAGIFQTADLPERTVKELVSRYGEGVVLIQTPDGLGSGFIINERGYCVTNFHVVEGQTRVAVTIFHRSENGDFERVAIRDVRILSLNPYFDLALLEIPSQKDLKFRPVFIADDDSQREGDNVFAIGSPLGLERSVSEGIISTRNRNMDGIVYIQTTAQINPGNSGGPLFNTKGEVVGVINMKLTFGEGLGFAIPVAYLKHFLRNRDAFAFDRTNPNTGYHYLTPPRRTNPGQPYEVEKK
ncbi:MAG: trypsin-like peptidase domain-containing protein [Planctomycetaceae bacterium]|nr:trypsin-like peptidase domain-containing protein [Planctomycetaceae bacterium]